MITRRFMLATMAAFSLATSAAHAVEKPDITIGMGPDWGTSQHVIMALKKGFFEGEGLNVTLKNFPAGLVQLEALAAGNLDFATPAQAPVFSLRSAGIPILILSNLSKMEEAMGLMVRENSGIKTPKDLEGKKIGLLKGSGSELMLKSIFTLYDIDATKVATVGLNPPEQFSALAGGAIDGAVTWEPWVSRMIGDLNATKIHSGGTNFFESSPKPAIVDTTRTVLNALEPMVRENPETVDALMRAISKAHDFLTDPKNDAEVLEIFSTYQNMDPNEAVLLRDKSLPSLALDQEFLDGMNGPLAFLESLGRIKNKINVIDFVYSEPLARVRPKDVSIEGGFKP